MYDYTCSVCKDRYVGETKRNLSLRIPEHKGISARTGSKIAYPSFSAIRSHSIETNHPLLDANFKILKKANHASDTKIYESLLIHKLKPQLNNQITSYSLSIL